MGKGELESTQSCYEENEISNKLVEPGSSHKSIALELGKEGRGALPINRTKSDFGRKKSTGTSSPLVFL
jgi:hypothetical protein